jgi:hypothetical protein
MIAALNALLGERLERLKAGLALVTEEQKAASRHRYDLLAGADKAEREARLATYSDFWAAIADLTMAQRQGDTVMAAAAEARLTEAKGRVLLHGSDEVVSALATFWRGGASFDRPDRMERFAILVEAMRRDAGGTGEVGAETVLQILFGGYADTEADAASRQDQRT